MTNKSSRLTKPSVKTLLAQGAVTITATPVVVWSTLVGLQGILLPQHFGFDSATRIEIESKDYPNPWNNLRFSIAANAKDNIAINLIWLAFALILFKGTEKICDRFYLNLFLYFGMV